MNLLSAYRKLRHMAPGELQGRLAAAVDLRRQRKEYEGRKQSESHSSAKPYHDLLISQAARLLPGASSVEIERLKRSAPELHAEFACRAASAAAAIAGDRHRRLGHNFTLAGKTPIDWHSDPRTGYQYARDFYADVKIYELADGVDVKYVWELGRQQYLPILARDWAYNRNPHSAELAQTLLIDWISNNPLYEGVHWTSALEVAVRSISWIWTLALLADWPEWSDHDLGLIAASAAEHANYLRRNFSFFSSPFNHLIGEATGLYLIGCWLDDHTDSRTWRNEASTALGAHTARQFYDDGFCVEQAVGYHFFTLGFLVLASEAGRVYDDDSYPFPYQWLTKAFSAGAAFQQPDGLWPPIGDIDSARAMPVEPVEFWDFSGICSLGAVLTNWPEWKRVATTPGEELFLLRGTGGIDDWNGLRSDKSLTRRVLPNAGYAIATGGKPGKEDFLLCDAGPLADGLHADATPSVAHGHADTMQLLLHLDAKPLLVDCGMPSYAGDREWIDHFRSSAAHNTIQVDGSPQAEFAGRLAWSHVAAPPRLEANLSDNLWVVRSQQLLAGGVKVVRQVLAFPGEGVWIVDCVESPRPGTVRSFWNFAPALEIKATSANSYRVGSYELTFDCEGTSRAIEAQENSPAAWQARGYGERTPARRIELVTKTEPIMKESGACRSDYCAFLGRQCFPVSLFANGWTHTSQNMPDFDVMSAACGIWINDNLDDEDATSVWFIQRPEEYLLVVCDPQQPPRGEGWEELHGAGGLPTFVLRGAAKIIAAGHEAVAR